MLCTTLDNFYLTDEELENSPSRKDGIDQETENRLRVFGAQLIQEATILLGFPQAVAATGQVLLQRFYCQRSLKQYNVKKLAAAATFLALKLEEVPAHRMRIRDVVMVFDRLTKRLNGSTPTLMEIGGNEYHHAKDAVIKYEREMLRVFGFIVHCDHPHKLLISLLNVLEGDQRLLQEAWNIANDSLRTSLCVRFRSEVVASGCIFYAARRLQVPLPEQVPLADKSMLIDWWEAFHVKTEELVEVVKALHHLYQQPKAQYAVQPKEGLKLQQPAIEDGPAAPPEGRDEGDAAVVRAQAEVSSSEGGKTGAPSAPELSGQPVASGAPRPQEGDRDVISTAPAGGQGQDARSSRPSDDEAVSVKQGSRPGSGRHNGPQAHSRSRSGERDSRRGKPRDRDRDRARDKRRRSGSRSHSRERRERDRDRERDRADRDRGGKDRRVDRLEPREYRDSSRGRDYRDRERDRDRYHDVRDGRDRSERSRLERGSDRGMERPSSARQGYDASSRLDRERDRPRPRGEYDRERERYAGRILPEGDEEERGPGRRSANGGVEGPRPALPTSSQQSYPSRPPSPQPRHASAAMPRVMEEDGEGEGMQADQPARPVQRRQEQDSGGSESPPRLGAAQAAAGDEPMFASEDEDDRFPQETGFPDE